MEAIAYCTQCGCATTPDNLVTLAGMPVCGACKPEFLRRLQTGAAELGAAQAAAGRRYRGFWFRVLSYLLDSMILGVLLAPLQFWVFGSMAFTLQANNPAQLQANLPGFFMRSLLLDLVTLGVTIAYATLMIGRWGATLGLMAIEARVVNRDGTPLGYAKALGRAFAIILSGVTLGIGFLMVAFDEQKRGLHDRICDTLVVQK